MLSARTKFLIFNFLGLEITWGACAYGSTQGMPIIGFVVGLLYLGLHFTFTENRYTDFLIMLSVGLLGILIDIANTSLGLIAFNGGITPLLNIPYWLIMLWLVFALMLPHSLLWLYKYKFISIILGAILGAFSYWLGHQLGAIIFPNSVVMSTLVYAIEWAIIFPIALIITKYFIAKYS